MHNVNAGEASIPALGFGTYRMNDAEVAEILPEALKLGFRHVDTAQVYDNEAAVGAAIKASGIARDDIFLTTKVWVTKFDPKDFLLSVEESLESWTSIMSTCCCCTGPKATRPRVKFRSSS